MLETKKLIFIEKIKKMTLMKKILETFLYENNKSDDYEIESTIKNITKELG